MTHVEKSAEIDLPIRTVYNQWTQFEEFPRFMDGVQEVKQVSDRLTHWITNFWGAKREFDAEIVDQVPDKRIAWRSVDGKTQAGVVTFHPISDNKTRVMVQMAYDPEGFTEKVADMLGLIGRRVQGDLDRFKQFIESRGRETGGWRGRI